VQGNGGIIVPPDDFLPELRRFCDETGALLITDEIQSGNGRSGTMWAAERFGVVPDILTIGKGIGGGMAVAAVASRRDLVKWGSDSYSSTFLTNNVNLAAAIASIEVMRGENLAARAAALGPKYLDILKQRLSGLPGVAEVRGFGLWYAVELADSSGAPDGKSAAALLRAIRAKGVLAGGGGYAGQCIKMAPPLTVDEDDLARGLSVIADAVTEWSAQRSTN
jgi:4-aminobutyrate aminotransferase-like enzyme